MLTERRATMDSMNIMSFTFPALENYAIDEFKSQQHFVDHCGLNTKTVFGVITRFRTVREMTIEYDHWQTDSLKPFVKTLDELYKV